MTMDVIFLPYKLLKEERINTWNSIKHRMATTTTT